MGWTLLTKRTDVPKLTWIMGALGREKIRCRLNGVSFDMPILEVAQEDFDRAWMVLGPIDDIADDDPMFDQHEGAHAWWANIDFPWGQRQQAGALFAAVGLLANKIRRSIADGSKCVPRGASGYDCPFVAGVVEKCPSATWTVCRPMTRLEVFGIAMAGHLQAHDENSMTKLVALGAALKSQGASEVQDMISFCHVLAQWMTRDGLRALVGFRAKNPEKLVRAVFRETTKTPGGRMPRTVEVEAQDMIGKAGTRCDLN